MIITETEHTQLKQLRDPTHLLTVHIGHYGKWLPHNDDNRWAVEQVRDWRASHPLRCADAECNRQVGA